MQKPKKVNKILIVKLAAIGDVMFASPLVANLKTNYPNAQIHWLADSWTKLVIGRISGIDKAYYYDRPWMQSRIKGYMQILPLLMKLRKESYDLAIIPHRSGLAFKFAKFAGVPCKVGFSNNDSNLDVNVGYDSSKHEVERNLDLLRALDLTVKTNQMVYEVDAQLCEELAAKYISRAEKYVCINPGGGKNPGLDMSLKRWPKEKYLETINKIESLGAQVVLLGSESDKEVCDFINQGSRAVNLCGKTSLDEAAALIKNCDLFIGNDSGLLYIAAAVGTASLGIYGPTDPKILAPKGSKCDYVAKEVSCSPCYHPQVTIAGEYSQCDNNQVCMKELEVSDVFDKAKRLLCE